jgi:hypothetical protein
MLVGRARLLLPTAARTCPACVCKGKKEVRSCQLEKKERRGRRSGETAVSRRHLQHAGVGSVRHLEHLSTGVGRTGEALAWALPSMHAPKSLEELEEGQHFEV